MRVRAPRPRWRALRMSAAGAALLALAACGGSAGEAAGPAGPAGPAEEESGGRGGREAPGSGGAGDCRQAFEDYVQAWTRWFEVELDDEEAVAQMVAAFEKKLPEQEALDEMRDVADDLRYEPGFERWLVALRATERAVEVCGEGARPGS